MKSHEDKLKWHKVAFLNVDVIKENSFCVQTFFLMFENIAHKTIKSAIRGTN